MDALGPRAGAARVDDHHAHLTRRREPGPGLVRRLQRDEPSSASSLLLKLAVTVYLGVEALTRGDV